MPEELLSFQSGQDTLAAVWHHADKPNSPIVMMHHGFSGNKCEAHRMFVKLARKLVSLKFDTFRFDFFGSGDSDGELTTATPSKWIQNSLDAISFLKSKGKTKFYVLGFSLGGFVAAAASANIKPSGLVLWSPIFHPLKRILQEKELLAQGKESGFADYQGELVGLGIVKDSALLKIPQIFKGYKNPVQILHGSQDEKASLTESAAYRDFYTKQGASVKYHLVEGANHSYERHDWETQLLEHTASWLCDIETENNRTPKPPERNT